MFPEMSNLQKELLTDRIKSGHSIDDVVDDFIKYGLDDDEFNSWLDLHYTERNKLRELDKAYKSSVMNRKNETQYGKYTLEKGDNYRELLFTIPKIEGKLDTQQAQKNLIGMLWAMEDITKRQEKSILLWASNGDSFIDALRKSDMQDFFKGADEDDEIKFLEDGAKKYYDELVDLHKNNEAQKAYKSDHWEEENIIAFTRVNDRTIDDKKTLFIEELQSDWHQAGRKDGYMSTNAEDEIRSIFEKYGIEWKGKVTNRDYAKLVNAGLTGDEDKIIENFEIKYTEGNLKIPDAPFKKNWSELGIKRMIQEAVANDYDKLAWTTGTQQAQRYSLEKKVDLIVYNKANGTIQGTYQGDDIFFKPVASDKEIEAIMGKELTKKLIDPKSSTRDNIYVLQGDDLEFGGEGMKAFYDKMIPNTVKKLFKKYKVKPKIEELDDIEEMVWSIDIPKEMKEDIKKYGQPLYVGAGAAIGLETTTAEANGIVEKGNIDLFNRPKIKNKDGSISTVRSISFEDEEGLQILIPTVIGNKIVSGDEAVEHYYKTGQHLGKFKTIESANKYAEELHQQQAKYYLKDGDSNE